MVISRRRMERERKQRFPSAPAAGHRGALVSGPGAAPAVLCRWAGPGGRARAAPGWAGRGLGGCRGGGAGRSAAPRAAAGSRGRDGPAAGDFMGRRRREVGLAFRLSVPSAGRARGGRCAGQRGRGTAVTESGSRGGTAALG